jgi:hypothetical protein
MQRPFAFHLRFVLFSLVTCLAVGSMNARAQLSGGTIAGTVTDPSGAVVPNATVTATGADTGTMYNTTSTSSGTFHFPPMQLGRYNLLISAPGFNDLKLSGIQVTTGNVSSAEAHLSTGKTSETVTVNAEAPTIETENSEVSNTISSRQVVDLPLSLGGQSAMRSVESFIFLAPGTVGPGTASTTSTSGAFQAKTAGGQNFGTEELLDGINVRRLDSDSAFDEHSPSVEALTELKVSTSIIPASEGRTTGGVENFTTKSGTNSYHGTAFDIFQNEDLNANDYFNKLRIAQNPGNADVIAANQRPLDKKNDYGGSAGGPVVIPHLYNGRNRTFGFFSYEQFRQNQSGIAVSTIPTAAVHNGDFSAGLTTTQDAMNIDCAGNPAYVGEVFDPATTSTVFNPALQATVPCRLPFAGNVIPAARFSTVAKKALAYYPLPNTGTAGQTVNNYSYSTSYPLLNTVYTIRIDQTFSPKFNLFVSYSDRDNDITNGHPPYPGPGGGVQIQHAWAKYLRIGSDYIFSPTQFNHLVAGLTRLYQINSSNSIGVYPDWDAQLGIAGLSGPNIPPFAFAQNAAGLSYNGIGYANDAIQPVSGIELSDTYTVIRGRHTLSFGVDFRKDQFSNESLGSESGTFNFSQYETAVTANDTQTGDSYASFLLGQVDNANAAVQGRAPRIGQAYYAAFVSDDFKLSKTLLINLGLRYDIDKPRTEAHGNFSNFSPTLPNAGAGGLPGAIYFAGTGAGRIGGSGEFAKTYRKDFAPRIGFAWAPDIYGGRTSIRGGFGVYYGPLDYADFGAANQLGFTASPNYSSPDKFSQAYCNGAVTTGGNPCIGTAGLDQSFPAFTPPPNLDPTQANGQILGGQLNSEYEPAFAGRPAAIYNWGLQVQQQVATDLILTIGYIGTTGTYLHSNLLQVNDLNPKYFGYGAALSNSYDATPGIAAPYPGFTGSLAQALRPFPQYLDIYSDGGTENLGHSSYNALTAKLERRFHNGLNLLAAYTWSRSITDSDSVLPAFSAFNGGPGSVQNPYNLKSEKALSFQDVPQNFVVSYLYELPVGKGKRFLNHGGVVNAVVGGYQVGGINRYLSGTPTAFSCTQTSIGASLACLRYDYTRNFVNHNPGANSGDPTARQVFDPTAFTNPSSESAIVLGTSPRVEGGYRTPLYANEDFSITKQIANFGEAGSLQLHVDIFNAFNRVHFSPPNTNPADLPTPGSPQGHFGSYNTDYGEPTIRQFILRYTF